MLVVDDLFLGADWYCIEDDIFVKQSMDLYFVAVHYTHEYPYHVTVQISLLNYWTIVLYLCEKNVNPISNIINVSLPTSKTHLKWEGH